MRRIKKLVVTFLAICLMCPGLSVITEAATAELRFADPSTTVGAEVDVKTKLSSVSSLQSMEATLTYDKSELKFISGDNATAKDGTIKISWTGTGTTAEFNLKFQALKEGTSNIEVSSATGTATDGSTLEITQGSSAVTIGAGDPSLIKDDTEDQSDDSKTTVADGPVVKVNGKKYVVGSEFSEELIPDGFKKGEMTFEGSKYTVITQEASGINAMYLTEKSSGESDFFLYNSDDGSFSPFEEVEIAKDRYIIPLMNDGKLKLSSRYQKTTLTLNGKEFDTWQDTKDAEYYIIYALNSDGEKTTYRYDTTDGTYQKYSPESQGTTSGNKANNGKGLWGKILNFVEEFLDIVVIIAIALFLLVLLMFIVTAIKLRHRDLELDDLYDEYGIDMDEEEAVLKEKKKEAKKEEKAKKASKKVKKKPAKKYYDEDEFEGYDDEDDFDDEDPWITENIAKAMDTSNMKSKKTSKKKKPSKGVRALDETGPAIRKPVKKINLEDTNDFEAFTPLDEEAFDNFEGYYSEDDDYDLFGAGYDDDDLFDATADLLSNHPEKRRSHAEMDDTFKMDVIDLD